MPSRRRSFGKIHHTASSSPSWIDRAQHGAIGQADGAGRGAGLDRALGGGQAAPRERPRGDRARLRRWRAAVGRPPAGSPRSGTSPGRAWRRGSRPGGRRSARRGARRSQPGRAGCLVAGSAGSGANPYAPTAAVGPGAHHDRCSRPATSESFVHHTSTSAPGLADHDLDPVLAAGRDHPDLVPVAGNDHGHEVGVGPAGRPDRHDRRRQLHAVRRRRPSRPRARPIRSRPGRRAVRPAARPRLALIVVDHGRVLRGGREVPPADVGVRGRRAQPVVHDPEVVVDEGDRPDVDGVVARALHLAPEHVEPGAGRPSEQSRGRRRALRLAAAEGRSGRGRRRSPCCAPRCP